MTSTLHQSHPSIAKFQQFVELKDFRPPTRKEYVRYVRKLAEHFGCDPLTLTEDQLRRYFLFLRQEKHYTRSPMKAAKFSLRTLIRSPPGSLSPAGLLSSVEFLSRLPKPLKSSSIATSARAGRSSARCASPSR